MSILAPAAYRAPIYTNHHVSNTSTGNGTTASCAGYGMGLLDVTVSATATIYMYGKSSSSGQVRQLSVQTTDGLVLPYITQSGAYRVDLTGIYEVFAAITTNTGSVTVRSVIQDIPMMPRAVALRQRNTLIASNASLTLAAGASASGTGIFAANSGILDVRDYAFVYYSVNGSVTHTTGWTLDQLKTWHDNTGPTLGEYETIMSSTARRITSEWQECRSPGVFLRLTNNDAVSRTYWVSVFGIR